MIPSGDIPRRLFRYKNAYVLTNRLECMLRPLLLSVVLRLFSRGRCWIEDEHGKRRIVNSVEILKRLLRFGADAARKYSVISQARRDVAQLLDTSAETSSSKTLALDRPPVYLRPGLDFGLHAGGSIGHIAGVVNNLDSFSASPVFISTDEIPTVRDDIETHYIRPDDSFWDLKDIPYFNFNFRFIDRASGVLESRPVAFVYQRYALSQYSGVALARRLGVPLVTEFNGSEVWVSRNWGGALKYDRLMEDIERLNVLAADLVVVVSQPIKDDLIGWGVEPERILVNPNGVDTKKYSPEIDGAPVRGKYGFGDRTVIGFIGTFGKWHGAEVLAESFGMLVSRYPEYRDRVRLLMIGDGLTMPLVKANLTKYDAAELATLTGMVPQPQGPAHLAAADILASPHVPNPDGTPFFGSPTKLFEYMAMGRGIAASELGQIGEILQHGETALLTEPGNAEDFMTALKKLIDEPDTRRRLAANARRAATEKHTWKEHTRRIVQRLGELCG